MPPRQPWSAITSTSEANRRAAGRRHYNAQRQFSADFRRIEVQSLIREYGFGHGVMARIARELGVAASTSRRDIRRLSCTIEKACPTCERTMTDKNGTGSRKSGVVGLTTC